MQRLRKGGNNCDKSTSIAASSSANTNAARELEHDGDFFYGRFFSETELPTFISSVHNAIEATRPGDSFMDEGFRTTGGRRGGNLKNATGGVIVPNINVRDGGVSLQLIVHNIFLYLQIYPHFQY